MYLWIIKYVLMKGCLGLCGEDVRVEALRMSYI